MLSLPLAVLMKNYEPESECRPAWQERPFFCLIFNLYLQGAKRLAGNYLHYSIVSSAFASVHVERH